MKLIPLLASILLAENQFILFQGSIAYYNSDSTTIIAPRTLLLNQKTGEILYLSANPNNGSPILKPINYGFKNPHAAYTTQEITQQIAKIDSTISSLKVIDAEK